MLYGIALAMAITLIVLSMLGAITIKNGFLMSGIGIFAIALEYFLKYTYGLHK
jgi:hypothetical protein